MLYKFEKKHARKKLLKIAQLRLKSPKNERRNLKNNCIYPGTFDPITNGHVDVVARGLKFFR